MIGGHTLIFSYTVFFFIFFSSVYKVNKGAVTGPFFEKVTNGNNIGRENLIEPIIVSNLKWEYDKKIHYASFDC